MSNTVYIVPVSGNSPASFYGGPNIYGDKGVDVLLREAIEEAGFKVNFSPDGKGLTDVAAILSWEANETVLRNLASYPRERCFFFAFEPPVTAPGYYSPMVAKTFGNVFTMFDDLTDNETFFKFNHPRGKGQTKMVPNIPTFQNKKFCVIVNSNKNYRHPDELYSERQKAISFFKNVEGFDLYGRGWNGLPCWRPGSVEDKHATVKNYKFSICYENMCNQRGYISEKIYDSLIAGCVPIYLGATNITEYVPKECFIDKRDFSSYEDLYHFMKGIDESTFNGYLTSIQNYVESPQIEQATDQHFVDTVLKALIKRCIS